MYWIIKMRHGNWGPLLGRQPYKMPEAFGGARTVDIAHEKLTQAKIDLFVLHAAQIESPPRPSPLNL